MKKLIILLLLLLIPSVLAVSDVDVNTTIKIDIVGNNLKIRTESFTWEADLNIVNNSISNYSRELTIEFERSMSCNESDWETLNNNINSCLANVQNRSAYDLCMFGKDIVTTNLNLCYNDVNAYKNNWTGCLTEKETINGQVSTLNTQKANCETERNNFETGKKDCESKKYYWLIGGMIAIGVAWWYWWNQKKGGRPTRVESEMGLRYPPVDKIGDLIDTRG